ncbi:MAG: hypothetical protein JWL64_1620 [Frankiales bacterium]|nr:hypothetical protein [Frankiales bacterium]
MRPATLHARAGSGQDGPALGVWLASRVAVLLVAGIGGYQLGGDRGGWLHRWDRWNVALFRKVADHGYDGYPRHYPDRGLEALFPGMPLVLRAVHVVVPSWTAAGLLISLVAGGVASVFLARLAALEGVSGPTAVAALVLSPYAVFLVAGYSEALFLGLAVPGWWCARQGRWVAAAVLVAGASAVDVNGLFLAVGLLVHCAATERRPRREVLWLLLPFAVVAGYAVYLRALTGDLLRWQHVQRDYWGRSFALPWDAVRTTWDRAHQAAQPEYVWSSYAELAAVLVGVLLVAALLHQAHWGEVTYVGLSVLAATSSAHLTTGRATLLWFPLWILLARLGEGRPAWRGAYAAVAGPLMLISTLTFTSGKWVG